MTPGRSLPAKTYGRSIRPGATTSVLARAWISRSDVGTADCAIQDGGQVAVVAAEHDRVSQYLDAGFGGDLGGQFASAASSAAPPQRRWPPSWCSSSTSSTRAPARAAATAAAIPAGPPPATSTSGWACVCPVAGARVSGETFPAFTNRRSTAS